MGDDHAAIVHVPMGLALAERQLGGSQPVPVRRPVTQVCADSRDSRRLVSHQIKEDDKFTVRPVISQVASVVGPAGKTPTGPGQRDIGQPAYVRCWKRRHGRHFQEPYFGCTGTNINGMPLIGQEITSGLQTAVPAVGVGTADQDMASFPTVDPYQLGSPFVTPNRDDPTPTIGGCVVIPDHGRFEGELSGLVYTRMNPQVCLFPLLAQVNQFRLTYCKRPCPVTQQGQSVGSPYSRR